MTTPWQTYFTLASKWEADKDRRLAHVLSHVPVGIPGSKFVYLIGVPDDRGVKNSHGRVGAANGPEMFRKYFGRLVAFEGAENMCDMGDVPVQDTIADTHQVLSELVTAVHRKNSDALVIVVGGGHDHAYGEISGVMQAYPDQKIGICNIDAHLDMRPVEKGVINSGTPFWRLWEDFGEHIGYHLTYGVQKSAMAPKHFQYAQHKRTQVVFAQDVSDRAQVETRLAQELELLFSAVDFVSVDIDLDAFSAVYAPGVSAPAVFGLTPLGVVSVLMKYVTNPFLKTIGIYELNPDVDTPDDLTSRLTAEIVYRLSESRVKAMGENAVTPKKRQSKKSK